MAPWKDWSISEGLLKRTIETIEQEGKPCPSLLMTKDCSSQKCPSNIREASTVYTPKWMKFGETLKGGGVISDLKNFIENCLICLGLYLAKINFAKKNPEIITFSQKRDIFT